MSGAGGREDLHRRHPFVPGVAALVLTMLVYSFASWLALDGVPDSESGLFVVMGAVLGLPMTGVSVASPALLLVARVAGVGMLASLGAVAVTRTRMTRSARRA